MGSDSGDTAGCNGSENGGVQSRGNGATSVCELLGCWLSSFQVFSIETQLEMGGELFLVNLVVVTRGINWKGKQLVEYASSLKKSVHLEDRK